jgi:hypothetical protein
MEGDGERRSNCGFQEPLDGDLEQYSTWTREQLGSEDPFKLAIDIDAGN